VKPINILLTVLVGLIPVFVVVTGMSVSRALAAQATADGAHHRLDVHERGQEGEYKLLVNKLDTIQKQLDEQRRLLMKGDTDEP